MTVTSGLKRYPNTTLWINQTMIKSIYSPDKKYFFFITRGKMGPFKHLKSHKTDFLSIFLKPVHSKFSSLHYPILWELVNASFIPDISIPHTITFSAEHKDGIPPFSSQKLLPWYVHGILDIQRLRLFVKLNYHIGEHGEMGQVGPIVSSTAALWVYLNKACACLMNITSCKTKTFPSVPTCQSPSCCTIPRRLWASSDDHNPEDSESFQWTAKKCIQATL